MWRQGAVSDCYPVGVMLQNMSNVYIIRKSLAELYTSSEVLARISALFYLKGRSYSKQ